MIIFLYGENSYRLQEKIKEFKEKFVREINPDSSAIYMVDAALSDAKAIISACQDGTLFARKKMVIISNWSLSKSPKLATELLEYGLSQKLDKSEDIFIFADSRIKTDKKQLVKIGSDRNRALSAAEKRLADWLQTSPYTQELKAYTPLETLSWIKAELGQQGLRIDNAALNLLPALAGYELWRLKNEIDKLSAYSHGQKSNNISAETVQLLVNGRFDPNIFALTDALGTRNHSLATRLLEEQYAAGAAPEYLSLMLGRHFRLLWRIKQAEMSGNLSQIKLNPFIIKKSASQAARFSEIELRQAANSLLELEYEVRSGRNDLKNGLIIWLQKL